jgi:hypothetical protein
MWEVWVRWRAENQKIVSASHSSHSDEERTMMPDRVEGVIADVLVRTTLASVECHCESRPKRQLNASELHALVVVSEASRGEGNLTFAITCLHQDPDDITVKTHHYPD